MHWPWRRALGHGRGCAWLVALTIIGPRALATPASRLPSLGMVEVTAPTCELGGFQTSSFLDSLRVELAGRGLACCELAEPRRDGDGTAALHVTLEFAPCVANGDTVRAVVRGSSADDQVAREIALSDVAPTARPRALALAVAELIRMLEQGARKDSPPAATVVEAPRTLPTSEKTPRSADPAMRLQGEARWVPSHSTTVWGGRLQGTLPWRNLHLDLDGGGGYASASTNLGYIVLRTASLGVGAGPRIFTRAAIVDLGVRAEVGWAWIHGRAAAADVHSDAGSGLTTTVGARAAVTLATGTKLLPSLAFEGGGAVQGIEGEADRRVVLGMAGYYFLAAVGIEVAP